MGAGKPKVLLAMSGGVDSAVAAALLLRAGYDVVGCFMRLGSPGEAIDELVPDEDANASTGRRPSSVRIGHQGCCSINDAVDARLVAARLGIPLYVCNFRKDFGRVIDYFVAEYNAGRTPNPCVRCNDWLKFGKLHAYARQIDAAFVASGHYARIEGGATKRRSDEATEGEDGPRLLRAVDRRKDQSYVLFGMPRERLGEMLLPIGEHRKSEVRRMAEALDLPVFDKPDSQEICFVPDGDYAGLVRWRSPESVRDGAIIDRQGSVLGEHRGHQHFTVGQRRGLGVAFGHPMYVVGKDPAANTVTIGTRDDLLASGCSARGTNWLMTPPPGGAAVECAAMIRSHAAPVPASVRATGDDDMEVRFERRQPAVAPGQAVVCYLDDAVLCGGWITGAL
ncbi:MAG: tRNA 2-thiouridine(34) synthase MnmA [Planctomycetota bacterium]|jgi:tRNA-specific 2-thiouridylase